jgi:hypothetical protein
MSRTKRVIEKQLDNGTIVSLSYEKIGGATHVYVFDINEPHGWGGATYTLIVAPETLSISRLHRSTRLERGG